MLISSLCAFIYETSRHGLFSYIYTKMFFFVFTRAQSKLKKKTKYSDLQNLYIGSGTEKKTKQNKTKKLLKYTYINKHKIFYYCFCYYIII